MVGDKYQTSSVLLSLPTNMVYANGHGSTGSGENGNQPRFMEVGHKGDLPRWSGLK